MGKEKITQKQAVSMVALFVVGSAMVLGVSKESMQDAWIAYFAAFAAAVPVIYVYARILGRYPGKSFFDICTEVFGKIGGKIAAALFSWFALHLGALVMRNFSEFIQVTAFNEMPQTISLLCMAILSIWIVRRGAETMGRWSAIVLPVVIFVVVVTILLLVKDFHPSYLLPVGEYLPQVPKDAWNGFSFPMAETVLFLGVLDTLKPGDRHGRAWLFGLSIGVAVLLFGGFLRNAMTLGFPLEKDLSFPSYGAVSIIIAGNFISRIENAVSTDLLLCGFIKISVCLMAASRGFASICGADDYRPYVAPVGLVMMALASVVYKNIMEMFAFIDIYPYYAFPVEVLLPLILCITAEIRLLIRGRKERGGKAPAPA
jgi:spore germination protein KB